MNGILGIALSGLNNATARIANAAQNIVNVSSTGKLPSSPGGQPTSYLPQDIISTSNGNPIGGVSTTQVPRNPSYTVASDPNSPNANAQGLVAAPNEDLNAELIASNEAEVSYGADAAIIKITNKMQKSLLDALS